MNQRVLAVGLVAIGALVALLAAGFGRNPSAVPFVLQDRPASPFQLERLGGGDPLGLESLKGSPTVINFWSTWCVPCKVEHPVLQAGARKYAARGVQFVGVLYGDEPEAAQRFLQRSPSVFPTVLDPGGRMAVDYGVAGVPETFFLDADGRIIRKVAGAVSAPVLVETLDAILREGA